MLRLAECAGKWLLVKCRTSMGWEYWYILPDLTFGCLNSQSEDYNAKNALAYLEGWGKATYVRDTIGAC